VLVVLVRVQNQRRGDSRKNRQILLLVVLFRVQNQRRGNSRKNRRMLVLVVLVKMQNQGHNLRERDARRPALEAGILFAVSTICVLPVSPLTRVLQRTHALAGKHPEAEDVTTTVPLEHVRLTASIPRVAMGAAGTMIQLVLAGNEMM